MNKRELIIIAGIILGLVIAGVVNYVSLSQSYYSVISSQGTNTGLAPWDTRPPATEKPAPTIPTQNQNSPSYQTPNSANNTVVRTVNQQEDAFLITKINPSSVEGILYPKWPVSSTIGSPKTFYLGENIRAACEGILENIVAIDFLHQTVTFKISQGTPSLYGCPKCLSGDTLIATPIGSISVQDLKIGMLVWTRDASGNRVAEPVVKTSKIPVPPTHLMVRLILRDGRAVSVSADHPTINGKTVGELKVGDWYDGAKVVSAEITSYHQTATYDILPGGETGFYWANGILLSSTLKP